MSGSVTRSGDGWQYVSDAGLDAGLDAHGRRRQHRRRGFATGKLAVWTPEQASAFLVATAGDRVQACWRLALSTGMRRGELAGLSWSDLDLERGRLQVTTQRTTDSDYQVVIKSPRPAAAGRSRSPRTRSQLCAGTPPGSRANGSRQVRLGPTAVMCWSTSSAVGCTPQRLNDLSQQAFDAAGLPEIRLHDLRHTPARRSRSSPASIRRSCRSGSVTPPSP